MVVVTILFRDCVPKLWRMYQERYIDPKQAHRQMFLDQADWFKERATKFSAFGFQLSKDPMPDKFELAELVSKLDLPDRQCVMKQTDVEILRKYAAEKGAECHDNAGECGRLADEIAYKIFWYTVDK